jgi:hypothetical protein
VFQEIIYFQTEIPLETLSVESFLVSCIMKLSVIGAISLVPVGIEIIDKLLTTNTKPWCQEGTQQCGDWS